MRLTAAPFLTMSSSPVRRLGAARLVPNAPTKGRVKKMRLLKRVASLWPFGQTRILLLEDDTSMQRLVAKLLRSFQVRVDVFGNGRAVIARIATKVERYDVLLLDLMMPHDGGLTVLRNLRDQYPSLLGRVILLTGSGSVITDRWSDLVFAVVHKPFDGVALVSAVRACVRQRVSQ